MPAIIAEPAELNEQMWRVLKIHITRERQRKKQGKIWVRARYVELF